MSQQPKEVINGANFTAMNLGQFSGLDNYEFSHPSLPFKVKGKVFLNPLLGFTSAEISLNKLPPEMSMPFHHKHKQNEEIYIFVKGKGEFQVDDERFAISEGTVICIAPEGVRCWRNLSTEPLYYIVVQAPFGAYHKDDTINDGIAVQKPVQWDLQESD